MEPPPIAAPRRKTNETPPTSPTYENAEIKLRPAPAAPVPAPRSRNLHYENTTIYSNYPLNYEKPPEPEAIVSNIATGAIKKETTQTQVRESAPPSTASSEELHTNSLSISAASKQLKDAISGTLTENLKSAQHNIDKKWNSATKHMKNVKNRFTLGNFSLKRHEKPEETFKSYDLNNQTTADPIFNNISFNSPLSEKAEPPTYEVPKSINNIDLYSTVNKNSELDTTMDSTDGIYGKIKKIEDTDSQSLVVLRSVSDEDRSIESWTNSNINNDTISLDESVESNEPIYANEGYQEMLSFRTDPNTSATNNLNQAKTKSLTQEILLEFDPLNEKKLDDWFSGLNHMNLLETLLMEDNYGNFNMSVDDDISIASIPQIPERVDSLGLIMDSDENESNSSSSHEENSITTIRSKSDKKSQKTPEKHESVIIHQNLSLPESLIEPHLAKIDDTVKELEQVDLSYPKPSQSSWYIDKTPDNFISNNLKEKDKDTNLPPKRPNRAAPVKEGSPSMKTKGSLLQSVLKLGKKGEVKSENMIPRPKFGNQVVLCQNMNFFKLPNSMVQDLLKEFSPRVIDLKNQQLLSYTDIDKKQLKEHINLYHLTSIQCLTNHKFYHEGKSEIHCFELNTAVPKNQTDVNAGKKNQSYVFASYMEACRDTLISKIIRSVTEFPKQICVGIKRGGWCYVKKSINSEWVGAWILLCKRRLIFYNDQDGVQGQITLDLRKARYIGLRQSDDGDIGKLNVQEKGPILLIDCPWRNDFLAVYFIFATMKETKVWSQIIKTEAHKTGTSVRHQQLTKNNVPVLVDKCINFVYTNGCYTEGIYRKSGSTTAVQKLFDLFMKDAFSVTLTNEYSEHDIASTLKKFFRELSEPLLSDKLSVSFISVSEMNSTDEKIVAYRNLLKKMGVVEYCTLKKMLGHLNFVQSLKEYNKMSVDNLSMVFGQSLLRSPGHSSMQYSHREVDVVSDLIYYYKSLFDLTSDELKKEQIMMKVLKKYHSAAENLSSTAKCSGDIKIWITLNPHPENEIKSDNELDQAQTVLTPSKTCLEVCRELSTKMKTEPHKLYLVEKLLNGELERPLHHSEVLLNCVLNWTMMADEDKKNNYIEVRPIDSIMLNVEKCYKHMVQQTPQQTLSFANNRTKSLKMFVLELDDHKICVRKKEKLAEVVKDLHIDSKLLVYFGSEKKRELSLRWSLTLVELDNNKIRNPFFGSVIAGSDINDQITWFAGIFARKYGDEILPNPEMIIP